MRETDLETVIRANHELFMITSVRMEALLAGFGLTYATAQALWSIDPDEAPPSMKVMSERLFCNAPNLSFIANQLAQRGYVERATDPADRRSRVLVLTPEGRRVRAEVVAGALTLSPFTAYDDTKLHALAALLTEVLALNPR
ncbi:MarR family winged helix-turn-helix transcriptional regulator [Catenuloplanes atrovinosus]|uniref:DNA-binding MarR family transcriptional regulator n=1 Tax=Catenuloplanes atrovinosus TaxID=137266 RepID=A0AAE3YRK2_9ACTN|nr:MarR family transcriptional regulator [Catenuloplanes atrovinosus]MDR7277158.1 DNA-binding MarR family transcriptional regulator [Catenuloplanes atrovinosus]